MKSVMTIAVMTIMIEVTENIKIKEITEEVEIKISSYFNYYKNSTYYA